MKVPRRTFDRTHLWQTWHAGIQASGLNIWGYSTLSCSNAILSVWLFLFPKSDRHISRRVVRMQSYCRPVGYQGKLHIALQGRIAHRFLGLLWLWGRLPEYLIKTSGAKTQSKVWKDNISAVKMRRQPPQKSIFPHSMRCISSAKPSKPPTSSIQWRRPGIVPVIGPTRFTSAKSTGKQVLLAIGVLWRVVQEPVSTSND